MHPNKIILTKAVDEDVGDQWYPAGVEVHDTVEVIARYRRLNRIEAKLLEQEVRDPRWVIWLEPTCHDCIKSDRHWCEIDAWDECEQCGHKSIPYLRDTVGDAPLVNGF